MSDGAATDGVIENDVVEAATEDEFAIGSKVPVGEGASPFDFEQLSTAAEQPSETEVSVELNLSPPTSKLSSWLPQAQDVPRESMSLEAMSAEPVPLDAMPVKITPHETVQNESLPSVSFAEHPQTELEGVQRLLSQMSQMQSDIQQESEALIAAQTEADFLAASYQESQQESHPAPHDSLLVAAETVAEPKSAELEPVVQAEEEAVPEVAKEPVDLEPELPDPDVQVALETQTGGDEPPDVWQQQPESGAEFQALFFEVNGVTFAVPLTELGGIHQLGEVNHLLGRPAWYLGLMTNREHQLDVVDTARWVMPEKLSSDEHQEEYRYIVMLGESKWGLACNVLHGTETLTELSVRWREKAGKRPWLAGMVKEKMCALIHVSELISMLNAGLDVKSVM
ncbi:chemotaxis protein CheW [Photobacterium sp. SDRW27]|nr:chemotaxis protein CheW [Photobacterium obscurum]MCW8328202.1 chemotaxis protein CheW [Photobacterium obscurum]